MPDFYVLYKNRGFIFCYISYAQIALCQVFTLKWVGLNYTQKILLEMVNGKSELIVLVQVN